MPREVTYAFSLASPWAYLGFDALHALVSRYHLMVTYKPVLLGEVFEQTGGLPLPKRHPARQAYRWLELKRWRVKRAVPLNLKPKGWPCSIAVPDRVAIALIEAGQSPVAYLRAAHRAIWVEERQLDDEAVLMEILASLGLPTSIVEIAKSERIGAIYASNRDWAIASGIFGAPTYGLDGELFWGQDRLEMLADMLASGRPGYTADPNP
ncbi:NahD 2-hydroxychromene-2-carboxylate isomerase [Rhabdaerophilaceae bacterium]